MPYVSRRCVVGFFMDTFPTRIYSTQAGVSPWHLPRQLHLTKSAHCSPTYRATSSSNFRCPRCGRGTPVSLKMVWLFWFVIHEDSERNSLRCSLRSSRLQFFSRTNRICE